MRESESLFPTNAVLNSFRLKSFRNYQQDVGA
jgi:hypothetical protein